jgi:hypothetical protein
MRRVKLMLPAFLNVAFGSVSDLKFCCDSPQEVTESVSGSRSCFRLGENAITKLRNIKPRSIDHCITC